MLACQRHLFSLPADWHYLNCASRAPLLRAAEAAGLAGLRWQNAPTPTPPQDYFGPGETLRERFGALVNAPPEGVAIVPSVSYGMAIAAHNVRLRPGQNVVVPGEEFPSNVYTWMARCDADGATLRTVDRPAGARRPGQAWNDRVLEAIDADTAVVSLSAVQWTDGLRFDLDAIGARAREVGALFCVDGTQSVGAMPFDFARVQPDLLVCAGYKWLLGPYQIGLAALGGRLLAEGRPFENHWSNRAGSEDVRDTGYHPDYRPGARRFDVGEHANRITVPMLAEGLRQLGAWGVHAIEAYCRAMMETLLPALEGSGLEPVPGDERCAHILGLPVAEPARLERIMHELKARNVQVSQRGRTVRVSPHVYNTEADMAALAEGLLAAGR